MIQIISIDQLTLWIDIEETSVPYQDKDGFKRDMQIYNVKVKNAPNTDLVILLQ